MIHQEMEIYMIMLIRELRIKKEEERYNPLTHFATSDMQHFALSNRKPS